nr:hypothetical protein [Tanacetum cinerariifolium]
MLIGHQAMRSQRRSFKSMRYNKYCQNGYTTKISLALRPYGASTYNTGCGMGLRHKDITCSLSYRTEEVQTCQNQIAQLNALITEIEAFDDPGEVFDTLMGLRDDVMVEQAKLMGLNELVTQVEEEIEMKEAQLEVSDG